MAVDRDNAQRAVIHRVDLVALRVEGMVGAGREQVVVRCLALVGVGEGTAVATDDSRDGHVEAAGVEFLLPARRQSGDGATEHGLAHHADGLRCPSEGGVPTRAGRRERAVGAQIVLPLLPNGDRLRTEVAILLVWELREDAHVVRLPLKMDELL